MKRILFIVAAVVSSAAILNAQGNDSLLNLHFNSAEMLLNTSGKLKIGGYGGVHYNQPVSGAVRSNGNLDVHRFVMMLGYRFNERTQFVTELEFEHVKEVYVEQAFLQYELTDYLNFRAGLMLIPMGIVNEYHEPIYFHGVERPLIDTYIVPSTWREVGIGFSGLVLPASLKYQAYLMNGFNGFDGEARLGGASGLRGGRQKAAESIISSPDLAVKIEYFGIGGLNLGLAGYLGETESTLFDGLDKTDQVARDAADSSVVSIAMTGLDARYQFRGIQLAGQFYYNAIGNTGRYNAFTANKGGGDLGSAMLGYYVDLGYNVLRSASSELKLIPFLRYSNYDTHFSVVTIAENEAFHKAVITTGFSLFVAQGAVFKTDLQLIKDGTGSGYDATFNAGFGIVF
ncbi:MAG: hypothetical protein K9J30_12065 [Bacteroidales bacterium]|nr:hypothetical protein [Bacteroidales bacterium]